MTIMYFSCQERVKKEKTKRNDHWQQFDHHTSTRTTLYERENSCTSAEITDDQIWQSGCVSHEPPKWYRCHRLIGVEHTLKDFWKNWNENVKNTKMSHELLIIQNNHVKISKFPQRFFFFCSFLRIKLCFLCTWIMEEPWISLPNNSIILLSWG
jgi:hypothetical protein